MFRCYVSFTEGKSKGAMKIDGLNGLKMIHFFLPRARDMLASCLEPKH